MNAISRAPLAELLPYKKRMGWKFDWVSSSGTDFNYDFHSSSREADLASGKILYDFEEVDSEDSGEEHHGISLFYRNGRARNEKEAKNVVFRMGTGAFGSRRWIYRHPIGE